MPRGFNFPSPPWEGIEGWGNSGFSGIGVPVLGHGGLILNYPISWPPTQKGEQPFNANANPDIHPFPDDG